MRPEDFDFWLSTYKNALKDTQKGSPANPFGLRFNHPRDKKRIRALRRKILEIEARKRGDHTREEWLFLVAMCNSTCVLCGSKQGHLTKDHIQPISLGGSNAISNIQPTCRECNSSCKNAVHDWRPEPVKEFFK